MKQSELPFRVTRGTISSKSVYTKYINLIIVYIYLIGNAWAIYNLIYTWPYYACIYWPFTGMVVFGTV